ARRKAAGLPAFTVMSCDNMPENGHVTRQVVTAYAREVDAELADVLFAFPGILLAIAVVAVLGSGIANVIVAVAIFSIPAFARLV
ncbi:hypothetical protein MJN51_32755, partial [Salmonella enterica subsp. enterica serovar Kentucky]|nr:hypothetical protein [Salmonella enterica subsp. enterica serovar Kentucky]